MSSGFDRICVIGIGLIGGSVAAACRSLPGAPKVYGIDADPVTVKEAVELGVVDQAAVSGSAQAGEWLSRDGVELVVLATPAVAAVEWLRVLGASGFAGVVTDVASTKAGVVAAARKHLTVPTHFVGGHPMAGSERSGVRAASADLFDGAYWILTPAADTDASAYSGVHALVSDLGARVVTVDAKRHDEAVAVVSHVPHVAAAALCDVAGAHSGEGGELLRLAAGGFKDTTRIAAGSPELWTGICIDNADALAAALREFRLSLGEFEAMVRGRDAESIRAWLESAAGIRRSLPVQWVPATTQLTQLVVPMVDRPGVVAEVTSAVSRAACNIEGIDIDHATEDRALLILVLTDEGDLSRLATELVDLGYEPRFTPLSDVDASDAS